MGVEHCVGPKEDGTYRCCIDFRKLNDVTVKDRYPLPKIDQSLEAMTGAHSLSSFDLRSSYHQVTVNPADRDKTAFICPRGLFRYKVMPFGLCNAGATFQRLMDVIMSGLHMDICLVYLDDVVIFSKSPAEHIRHLQMVLERLSHAGLKLKPEKCQFLQKSVRFLGHIVSSEGIGTDPEKTRAVAEWPTPTSVHETRQILGLAGYYRRFIKNFAQIAAPLHALTRKNVEFRWTAETQEAFDSLKAALTSSPILAMPNDTGEFILDCDAADQNIGCVLSQVQDGVEQEAPQPRR